MDHIPDPLESGPQLHLLRTRQWLVDADITGPIVIFIHGLGANSDSLLSLAHYIDRTYPSAVYNYASHIGIADASNHLSQRLERFAQTLASKRLVLIGHSMGGLVSKHFARHAAPSLREAVAGIATLGTPHDGVIRNGSVNTKRRLLNVLVNCFEADGIVDPFALSPRSAAFRQLVGPDPLVGTLLAADRETPLKVPFLTISGGHNRIDLFRKDQRRLNKLANALLQPNMARPNDGLVEETSADLSRLIEKPLSDCGHCNNYVAWTSTNHTHLGTNQGVAERILDWLRTVVFPTVAAPRARRWARSVWPRGK